MKTEELKRQWKNASEYVAKYGAIEPHLGAGLNQSIGRIHKIEVSTEITHQSSPGAKNYWKDEAFDDALASVIKARFTELAKVALVVMEERYKQSLVSEKDLLMARLAEIREIESES